MSESREKKKCINVQVTAHLVSTEVVESVFGPFYKNKREPELKTCRWPVYSLRASATMAQSVWAVEPAPAVLPSSDTEQGLMAEPAELRIVQPAPAVLPCPDTEQGSEPVDMWAVQPAPAVLPSPDTEQRSVAEPADVTMKVGVPAGMPVENRALPLLLALCSGSGTQHFFG